MKNSTSKKITFISLLSAILCVISPLSIPIGSIPISFTTLIIFLISAIVNYKIATLSTIIYILIGLVGLPVFANFQGGVSVIFGGSGGFILGYILCAFITSFTVDKFKGSRLAYVLAMLTSTLILYIIGTAWFMVITKTNIVSALLICVLPFILFDILKIIIATILYNPLKKALFNVI